MEVFATGQKIVSKVTNGKYEFVKYIDKKVIESPFTGNITVQDCVVKSCKDGIKIILDSSEFKAM